MLSLMPRRAAPVWRLRARLGCVLLVLLSVGARTSAQQSASIIGQVTDEGGGVLPGVTVTVTSPALQLPEMVVITDERGEYRITPLPIGTYQVMYTLAGFQSQRRPDIRLTLGFVAKLDIVLKIGSMEETITVSGTSPVVDVTTTGTRTELTKETLELTPTGRNGLQALLVQTPGVRTNLDIGGSTINDPVVFRAYGQSNESWSTMDGILTTSSKDTQSGNFFDYTSYEEARVQAIGNDAEVPVRGVSVTTIIKSGSNEFHGTGYLGQTNSNFQSDNIDSELQRQGVTRGDELITRWDRSIEVGGRVIRDKLWFFGSTRWRKNDTTVLGVLQDDGSPAIRSQRQGFHTQKGNYQLSRSNRINAFHQWHQKLETRGVSVFVPWESRLTQDTRDNTQGVEWTATIGNALVTSVQTGYWNFDSTYLLFGDFNRPATTDVVTQYVTGPNVNQGNIPLETRHHTRGAATWYKPGVLFGNHEIRAGFDYITNVIKRGWVSRGSNLNYQLQYSNGQPFQLQTWNYPVVPESDSNYLDGYVRDNWIIGRRLTLNVGARFERDLGFVPDQCREDAEPREFGPAACFDRVEMEPWTSVAPRVYAAYDITGDGQTVVKGGWGRFYAVREVEDVLPFNLNIAASTTWRWRDLNGDRLYQPGEVNLDPNGPDFISRAGRGTDSPFANGVINPDEKQPYTDQLSTSIERQLMPNFAVRASGIYSKAKEVRRVVNTARPYEVYNIPIRNLDPGPDGVLNSADDTGNAITYFDYPASLSGLQFQRPTWANPPGQDQTFKSIEFSTIKRLANRWQFMASYSATKINAPFTRESDYNPNAEINTADHTWEWSAKVSGAYRLMYGITASANFDHRSGTPQARQVLFRGGRQIPTIVLNVEPIGSLRLPHTNILDFRAEKSIRITGSQRVNIRVNVYNVLNANAITAWTLRSGPDYLRPTAITPPRIVELSGSYSF
jgi:hypothetical protein